MIVQKYSNTLGDLLKESGTGRNYQDVNSEHEAGKEREDDSKANGLLLIGKNKQAITHHWPFLLPPPTTKMDVQ